MKFPKNSSTRASDFSPIPPPKCCPLDTQVCGIVSLPESCNSISYKLCSAKELFAVGATSNKSKLKNFAIAVDRDSPISVFINRFPPGVFCRNVWQSKSSAVDVRN